MVGILHVPIQKIKQNGAQLVVFLLSALTIGTVIVDTIATDRDELNNK